MLNKYFSFKGRINRKVFWLRNLALYGFAIAFYLIFLLSTLVFLFASNTIISAIGILGLLFLPLILAFYVSTFSLAARRLHDRNKSGWWLLGYFAVFFFIGGVGEYFGQQTTLVLIFQLIGFVVALWYIIEIGFLRGTNGANKFGEDPLTGGSADPSVFE